MKVISGCYELTEIYQLNLQLPSALQSFIVSPAHCLVVQHVAILLWFTLINLITLFSVTAGSCFQRISSKNLPAQQQTADSQNKNFAGEHSEAFNSQ